MNLKEARKLIQPQHLDEAIALVGSHCQAGFGWLFERTGREEPDSRYIVFEDGVRYPTKAFGFLVAQLAGRTDRKSNDMTVDDAAAPLKKLGGVDIKLKDRSGGKTAQIEDETERKRKLSYYQALARPEQAKFRKLLLQAYSVCAISGADVDASVEAAHVKQFALNGLDTLGNGILLRCDLHSLFDAGHLAIDPNTMTARFSKSCLNHYSAKHSRLDGMNVTIPAGGPAPAAFEVRWKAFIARGTPYG